MECWPPCMGIFQRLTPSRDTHFSGSHRGERPGSIGERLPMWWQEVRGVVARAKAGAEI